MSSFSGAGEILASDQTCTYGQVPAAAENVWPSFALLLALHRVLFALAISDAPALVLLIRARRGCIRFSSDWLRVVATDVTQLSAEARAVPLAARQVAGENPPALCPAIFAARLVVFGIGFRFTLCSYALSSPVLGAIGRRASFALHLWLSPVWLEQHNRFDVGLGDCIVEILLQETPSLLQGEPVRDTDALLFGRHIRAR